MNLLSYSLWNYNVNEEGSGHRNGQKIKNELSKEIEDEDIYIKKKKYLQQFLPN